MPPPAYPQRDLARPGSLPCAWLHAVLDRVPGGVVVTDGEGSPLLANAAARALLGLGPAPASDGLDQLAQCFPRKLRRAWVGKHPVAQDFDIERDGVKRRVAARTVPVGDAGGAALVLLSDSESAERGDDPRKLRSVVHDVKGPLNALALNLELLRQSLVADEDGSARDEQLATAELLRQEIARLGRALDSLLERIH